MATVLSESPTPVDAPSSNADGASTLNPPDAPPPPPAQAREPGAADPAPAVYKFHEMRLRVGDSLQVEPPPQVTTERARATLIGYLDGHSVVVTVPRTPAGPLELREGENVLVRTFTGKRAFAFKSSVLKVARLPFVHLHLVFPKEVKGVDVRSSPRYRVQLPATIIIGEGKPPVQAVIDNIGTTGALVEAAQPLGKGVRIRLDFSLTLHGVPASLTLNAIVRNTTQVLEGEGPGWRHGLQFEDIEDKDRLILGSLVWYHMSEHPRALA